MSLRIEWNRLESDCLGALRKYPRITLKLHPVPLQYVPSLAISCGSGCIQGIHLHRCSNSPRNLRQGNELDTRLIPLADDNEEQLWQGG